MLLAYPRVRAAWELHDLAAKAADYALCMAGPTGPELIRDNGAEFRRLVRRRLIAAAPDEAPFAKCSKLSRLVSGADTAETLHLATAARFAEYAGPDGAEADLSLSQMNVELTQLVDRARAAWPFVRGGYAKLIRASLGAREAIHPVAPARSGAGRGLPSERALLKRGWRGTDGLWVSIGEGANRALYTSADEGVTFRKVRPVNTDEQKGGCGGRERDRGFSLSSREDGSLLVSSFAPNREPATVTAVLGEHTLLAIACDEQALVLAARPENKDAAQLLLCAHERACIPLRGPERKPFSPLTHPSFDLARVASATVLAVEQGGIVRVTSTRDDGRTWTPPTVAFDAADAGTAPTSVPFPSRLLAVGQRLFLYGVSRRPGDTYPLLVSDDQGASFRALDATPPAPPARVAQGDR